MRRGGEEERAQNRRLLSITSQVGGWFPMEGGFRGKEGAYWDLAYIHLCHPVEVGRVRRDSQNVCACVHERVCVCVLGGVDASAGSTCGDWTRSALPHSIHHSDNKK